MKEALRLNTPVTLANNLKEDLRPIWLKPDQTTARRVLDDWLARANASGIRMLQSFAATMPEQSHSILADYDYPASTGPLEGTHTKIQLMKRQAHGSRDHEFFMLKIRVIHQTKYTPTG